jgi:hypothetical protein
LSFNLRRRWADQEEQNVCISQESKINGGAGEAADSEALVGGTHSFIFYIYLFCKAASKRFVCARKYEGGDWAAGTAEKATSGASIFSIYLCCMQNMAFLFWEREQWDTKEPRLRRKTL